MIGIGIGRRGCSYRTRVDGVNDRFLRCTGVCCGPEAPGIATGYSRPEPAARQPSSRHSIAVVHTPEIDMQLRAKSFGQWQPVHWGSDLASLNFNEAGLFIRVACNMSGDNVQGFEVVFRHASAFRVLDELDLARYWTSAHFPRGFHVLEVEEGGWLDEESQLQGYVNPRREWLIVTGSACVSVFCSMDPQIENASWRRGIEDVPND